MGRPEVPTAVIHDNSIKVHYIEKLELHLFFFFAIFILYKVI